MAIEIVDFPIKNGGSFHSYVSLPEGIQLWGWFPCESSHWGLSEVTNLCDDDRCICCVVLVETVGQISCYTMLYLLFFLMTYGTSVFKINIFYCLVLPCSSWQNPQSWFQSTKFGSIPELRSDPFFSLFIIIQNHSWLVVSTPLKNISWDYDSQYMEKNVPNHQPD